jgi:hypothetical protein
VNPSPSLRVLAEQARDAKRDRATSVTGGMDCMECGRVFFGAEDMLYCGVCHAEKAFRAATPSTTVIALLDEIEALRKAAAHILPYLRFTIGPESPGHHPTMPSAVTAFEEAFGFTELSSARAAANIAALNGEKT